MSRKKIVVNLGFFFQNWNTNCKPLSNNIPKTQTVAIEVEMRKVK